MNIGQLAIKGVFVVLILFFLSLVGAITFPLTTPTAGAGGIVNILIFLIVMLFLAVVGYLFGKGIRTAKKPIEAIVLTYIGAIAMGAILTIPPLLQLPYIANVHLNWLGSNWYSAPLTIFIIGSPIMLTFLAGE
jgi:hypothetical protein